MLRYVSILVLVASGITAAQDPKKPQEPAAHPGVDQKRVNRAIHKGIEFLKTAESPGHNASKTADELLLLTFVHAGAETSPRFKELFEKMMQGPLEATYNVALQAMILEELDRVRHQARIHQCAQFLIDNECANGQWSYGTPGVYRNTPPGNVVCWTPCGHPGSIVMGANEGFFQSVVRFSKICTLPVRR